MATELEKEIVSLQSQYQILILKIDIQNQKIDKQDIKIDKLELFIIEQLKDIKNSNNKIQDSIDDLISQKKFIQGFVKAMIVVTGIIGFGLTSWTKLK